MPEKRGRVLRAAGSVSNADLLPAAERLRAQTEAANAELSAALAKLGAQAEAALAVWEVRTRDWEAALATLTRLGVDRAKVERLFCGWDDELFADQSRIVAARLLRKYREILPLARDFAEAHSQSAEGAAPDASWLESRIAALEHVADARSRKPFNTVQAWRGLGDRAVALFDLVLPRVKPKRRQALGRRQPVFVREALDLTLGVINAHPDLRRWGVRMTPADLKSRLASRGRKAKRTDPLGI